MTIRLPLQQLKKQILANLKPRLEQVGRQWLQQTQAVTPIGPTGDLQKGLTVKVTTEKISIHSNQPYAFRQRDEVLTHVPPTEIGRRGWHHYGRRSDVRRGNTLPARAQMYYAGLALAHRQNAPRYAWNYAKEGLNRVGIGDVRRILSGGLV